MLKIVEVGSWSEAPGPPVSLVKVSARGLRGTDRSDFLKIASPVFAEYLDRVRPQSGDVPIHIKAVHALESWGPNRNGDAFTEETCRKFHDTFVKHARYYKQHKNKDPARSYGAVKLSAYNPAMRRIELLVFGNGTKEAAERNGGLVMDQETVDALHRGDDVPFSMACKVAYDVCSNCGNKAASRAEYCTEETCVNPETGRRGFGCRSGLMKLAEDGFLQYVDNPAPRFFDISQVVRPADRQAYGHLAEYVKVAADDSPLGGAALAELLLPAETEFELLAGTGASAWTFGEEAAWRSAAEKLAAVEEDLVRNLDQADRVRAAALLARDPLPPPASPVHPSVLRKLARAGAVLPLREFAALQSARADAVSQIRSLCAGVAETNLNSVRHRCQAAKLATEAAAYLPGIFRKLAQDEDLAFKMRAAVEEGPLWTPPVSPAWFQRVATARRLDKTELVKAAAAAAIRGVPAMEGLRFPASGRDGQGPGAILAQRYALYLIDAVAGMEKLATADTEAAIRNGTRNLTLRALLLQNADVYSAAGGLR